ncbi:respiratory nitrate reductase subunit gamma [candidate division KSB1 bacterium]
MNLPAILFSLIGWTSLLLFFGGLIYRIYIYSKTPMPLKIPVNTPPTLPGVVGNMAIEVTLFRKVFKTNPLLWIGAWIFHVSFLFVIIRHLRFFLYPIPAWIMSFYTVGIWAGYFMLGALFYLLGRRVLSEKNVYVSIPIDYYLLLVLIGIAGTGIMMNFNERIYLVDIKAFVLGLYSFHLNSPDVHPVLFAHLLLVFMFLAYFPFSKLLHAPGVFFSPTMIQRNDIEKRRTVNPWDYDVPSEPFYTLENFDEIRTDRHPEVIEYPPGWERKVDYDKLKKN